MVNLSKFKEAEIQIKSHFAEVHGELDMLLLKSGDWHHGPNATLFADMADILVFRNRVTRQIESLNMNLLQLRSDFTNFDKGDFSEAMADFDENEYGKWDAYTYIKMMVDEIFELPAKLSNYTELTTELNRLGFAEIKDQFDLFIAKLRAMILLNRPFSEMLSLFQD